MGTRKGEESGDPGVHGSRAGWDSARFEASEGSIFSIGGGEGEAARGEDSRAVRAGGPAEGGTDTAGADAGAGACGGEARYRILREIARGGMGAILEAEDLSLGRSVAMKVMLAVEGAAQPEIGRFEEEARVTGSLEHPNIVPVHELGSPDSGRRYFTMKLVRGVPLSSIIRARGSGDGRILEEWPLRRLLGVLLQVCNAVAFAHARGVLHRDLKPDNVMVGDFGEVLVMDWGLAKRVGSPEAGIADSGSAPGPTRNFGGSSCLDSVEGSVIGTPAYMPPEQARGELRSIDERSDVFALGAMLFEILAGRPPYSGATTLEVLGKAAKADFPSARIPPNAPRSLAEICLKAMSAEPDSRHASVKDFARAIEAFLDHRVIPSYSLASWQKAAQTFAILAAAALVVLAMSSWNPAMLWHLLDYPSLVGVLAFGVAYHGIVRGWGLRFRRTERRRAGGLAKTASMEILQEGFYLGGMVCTLVGVIALLSSLTWLWSGDAPGAGTSRYYSNTLVIVYAATYYLPTILAARLGFIREARQNSLFGLISPAGFPFFLQLLALAAVVLGCLVGFMAARGDAPALAAGLAADGAIERLSARAAALVLTGCALGALTFRLVFTFRELAAALGHFCSRLAGGEVDRTNRAHAASVIRFLTEAIFFWILYASFVFAIVAARLELIQGEGRIGNYAPNLAASVSAVLAGLAAYAALAWGAMRAFAGDGGEVEERGLVERALAAKDPANGGRPGARDRAGFALACTASLAIMVFIISVCGVDPFSPRSLPLYAPLLAFLAIAVRRRARIRRQGAIAQPFTGGR